ncbi:hypothetical protein QA811_43840 [Streptomyces sp. B21-102]|uniref:hypothetical protein n=1 Tax=Streptomyces sp. B21-102 TaxID=3039416 RepID=UPI002FF0B04C
MSGIPEEVLGRTLIRPGSLLLDVNPEDSQSAAEHTRAQLFVRIQSDAEGRGLTVRTLAARHGVSQRTVRKALDTPAPPAEGVVRRRFPSSNRSKT